MTATGQMTVYRRWIEREWAQSEHQKWRDLCTEKSRCLCNTKIQTLAKTPV